MKSVISIIIPVYKAEKWISRCIESVIDQSYKNLDIILINDGSPDKSGSICDEYAKKDKRIIVIHKKNEGPSIARNIGLKLSVGDYIQFVDSDDWLSREACEILLENMEQENVNQVVCGLNVTKNGKTLRTPHLPRKKYSIFKAPNEFFELLKIFASPCNKLYKKEYITHGFDPSLSAGEDLIFNLNYLKNTDKILTIPECLYNVSLDNDQSLNRKFRLDRLDLFLKSQDLIFEFCDNIYGENYNKTILYNKSVLGVHAYYRNVCKNLNKNQAIQIIKKYFDNEDVNLAAHNSKLERFDYKLFNLLLKNKQEQFIFLFFKLKLFIEKINNLFTSKG